MKISSSEVAFRALHNKEDSHHYEKQTTASEQRRRGFGIQTGLSITETVTDLSYQAKMRHQQSNSLSSQSIISLNGQTQKLESTSSLETLTRTTLGLNAQTARINIELPVQTRSLNLQHAETYQNVSQLTQGDVEAIAVNASGGTNARLDITEQHFYKEKEKLQVDTQGTVTTADGRQINFLMELEMERSFELEESMQIRHSEREVMDPLMINLGNAGAALTSTSFSFDLDADGTTEQISFATGGSGFLALDINNDNKINDGSELFGTQGSDGFAHLARYDDDGNKWIDESDEVFDKLKIWSRDEAGNDQLISLKQAGVGAIYLGAGSGNFDLTDSSNQLLGQVKSTGMFLMESGEAGSIQEVDLAIHPEAEQLQNVPDPVEQNLSTNVNQTADTPRFVSIFDLMMPENNPPQMTRRTETTTVTNNEQVTVKTDNSEEQPKEVKKTHSGELGESILESLNRLIELAHLKQEKEYDENQNLKDIIQNLRKHHLNN
ncbi:hypothetical protein [Aliamphritea ceti]|uniref:hypothetical protein n=1 Tax=Aliamphritea ceti TaxID=1524258 RepID=UPI0021C481F7|nr:hypothetical protein [Aliamphritea ceti]